MSYTTTPNLGLKLIDFDTETNSWGYLTNDNWSAVDTFAGTIGLRTRGRAWRTSSYIFVLNNAWEEIPLNAGDAELVNISHSIAVNSEKLIIEKSGVFFVQVSATFADAGIAHNNFLSIGVNGNFVPGCPIGGRPGATGGQYQTYTVGVNLSLSQFDYVSLLAATDAVGANPQILAGTGPTGVVSAQLNIVEL